jgi:hypothetical protein
MVVFLHAMAQVSAAALLGMQSRTFWMPWLRYPLRPLGEAGPVVDAGGIFEYARQQGMIKTAA